MKRIGLGLAAAVVLVLAPALGGCDRIKEKLAEKAAEKAIETASGGEVKVSSGGTTVTTKDGTATLDKKLPDDWPSNVPLYPGAVIGASMTTPNGKTVVFETKDSAAKVHDFYKAKLSGMKMQIDADLGNGRTMSFQDGKKTVGATMSAEKDKTTVTLSIAGG